MKTEQKPRRNGAAFAFIEAKLATRRVAFSLADLVKETGLSNIAAKNQLLRLGSQVVRVSRPQQFFLIVSPEHRVAGAPPVVWWLDEYFCWLGRPYYLALQSAAGVHGVNHEALPVTHVMTDAPRREIKIGRLTVRFFVKRGIAQTSTQSPPNVFAPLRFSTPEATAFDLVRYAPGIGGIMGLIKILVPLFPLMRVPELERVLNAENENATAQRLGYIVETAGNQELAEAIRNWLPSHMCLVPLAPSKGNRRSAQVNQRWRLSKMPAIPPCGSS